MLKHKIIIVTLACLLAAAITPIFSQSAPMGEMLHLFNDEVSLHKESNDQSEVLTVLPIGHPIEVLDAGEPVKTGWYTFSWMRVRTWVDKKIWEGWLWSENVADVALVDDWDGDGNWEYLLSRNRTYIPFSDYRIPLDQSLLDFKLVMNGEVVEEWSKNIFGVEALMLEFRPMVSGFEPEFNCVYMNYLRATDADSHIEDTYLWTFTGEKLVEALHYYTLRQPGYTFEMIPQYPGDIGIKKNTILLKVEIEKEGAFVDPSKEDENTWIWNGETFDQQKRD